jgi:hypothetical protein
MVMETPSIAEATHADIRRITPGIYKGRDGSFYFYMPTYLAANKLFQMFPLKDVLAEGLVGALCSLVTVVREEINEKLGRSARELMD